MLRKQKTLLSAFIAALFLTGPAAWADMPYYFIKVSCVKELHSLSVQTFMLWNVCTDEGCSNLSSLSKQGIYELAGMHKKSTSLPACDLGYGKTAKTVLSGYEDMNLRHGESGAFTVTVNGKKVADLSTEDDNDLRITTWEFSGSNKEPSPRIDVNLCTAAHRTSIDIPESFQCSFEEMADDGHPFLPQKSAYGKLQPAKDSHPR